MVALALAMGGKGWVACEWRQGPALLLQTRLRAARAEVRFHRTDRREEVVVLVITTRRGLPPESSSPGSVRTTRLTERLI